MKARPSLEARVAALESESRLVKEQLMPRGKTGDPWWDDVWGAFADDPAFEEAIRLGRKWRATS